MQKLHFWHWSVSIRMFFGWIIQVGSCWSFREICFNQTEKSNSIYVFFLDTTVFGACLSLVHNWCILAKINHWYYLAVKADVFCSWIYYYADVKWSASVPAVDQNEACECSFACCLESPSHHRQLTVSPVFFSTGLETSGAWAESTWAPPAGHLMLEFVFVTFKNVS